MGAIIDTLLIGKREIGVIEKRYPHCVIRNMTNTRQLTQRFRLIIPDEDLDDAYYNFLVENSIAMSSMNFRCRLESDSNFAERMKAKLHWLRQERKGNVESDE